MTTQGISCRHRTAYERERGNGNNLGKGDGGECEGVSFLSQAAAAAADDYGVCSV